MLLTLPEKSEEFLRLKRYHGWQVRYNSICVPAAERWKVVDSVGNVVAYGRCPAEAFKNAWRNHAKV
jgi:hypothetical protein